MSHNEQYETDSWAIGFFIASAVFFIVFLLFHNISPVRLLVVPAFATFVFGMFMAWAPRGGGL